MASWSWRPGLFWRRQPGVDCTQLRDLSSEYVEGELPKSLSAQVREHLRRCSACAAFVDTLRATLNLLRSLPPRKAPLGLREAIKRRLRGSSLG